MHFSICIPTRNRAAQLDALLCSLAPYVQTSRFSVALLVSDQSNDAVFDANARAIARFGGECGITTFHWGGAGCRAESARRWLRLLSSGLKFSSELGYGASRNHLLLASAGTRSVWLDDDVIFSPRSYPDPDRRLHSISKLGWRLWPKPSESTRRYAVGAQAAPKDALDCMIDTLGVRDRRRVVVSMPGVYGDSGLGSHGVVPFERNVVPTAVHEDRAAFEHLISGQDCIRQSASFVVSSLHGFLATSFGLDNSQMVCPFAPTGRGEDQIWSVMQAKIDPGSGVAHLPWVIHHRGKGVDKRPFPDLASSTLWVALSVNAFDATPDASAGDAMALLGDHLCRLAKIPMDDYLRELRECAFEFFEKETLRLREELNRCAALPWKVSHLSIGLLEWERAYSVLLLDKDRSRAGLDTFREARRRCMQLGLVLQRWHKLWILASTESPFRVH